MALNSEELRAIRERKARKRESVNSQSNPANSDTNNPVNPTNFSGDYDPVNDQTAIAAKQNLLMTEISQQLTKIKSQRDTAIEQISDILAYLHSPITFKNDVLKRTMEKLGETIEINPGEVQNNPFEGLGNCFELKGYNLPQIAPYSSQGALPM
jgi:hypothetical protein